MKKAALVLGAVFLALVATPAIVGAQTAARPAAKKPTSAAADKDAKARKQLRAILDAQTEGMLKCYAIRDEWTKVLMDRSITSIQELDKRTGALKNDWETCTNDLRSAALAEFAKTGASEQLQQAAWTDWLQDVKKRHQQEKAAADSPAETKH